MNLDAFIIFFFFKIGYNWNQLDTIDIWIYVVTQDVFEVLGSRQLRIIKKNTNRVELTWNWNGTNPTLPDNQTFFFCDGCG